MQVSTQGTRSYLGGAGLDTLAPLAYVAWYGNQGVAAMHLTYYPIRKCRSFWTWLFFYRYLCGRHIWRVCGWDTY